MMPFADPFEEITGEAPKMSKLSVEHELGEVGQEGELNVPPVSGRALRLSSAAAT
jgi:hypothetical protein